MIKRIVGVILILCVFIAIPLSAAGVQRVDIGGAFYSFLKSCAKDLEGFKIAIPNIPSIPRMESPSGFFAVIDVLIQFINGISNFINFGITLSNYVIQLIEFICIIIGNFVSMRNILWS